MSSCDNKKKPEQCLKKSNILIYKTPVGEKRERPQSCPKGPKASVCNPMPKKIRVCTGAELRKMCPPPECPKMAVQNKRFGILRFLGFGLKAAVAAACVYVTYDLGVWGSTEDTQDVYRNACALFGRPEAKKRDTNKWDPPSCEAESHLFRKPPFNPHGDCEQPPISIQSTTLKFQYYWNTAIRKVFTSIAGFPGNVMGMKSTLPSSGQKAGDEQELGKCECVPYGKLEPEEQEKIKNRYK